MPGWLYSVGCGPLTRRASADSYLHRSTAMSLIATSFLGTLPTRPISRSAPAVPIDIHLVGWTRRGMPTHVEALERHLENEDRTTTTKRKEKKMTDREQYAPGPGERGAGTKGRREVDAHSRQRTAPPAGKSLAGANRSGASARVGALRSRWKPGHGWNHGEAHLGGNGAGFRNKSDASRRSQGA